MTRRGRALAWLGAAALIFLLVLGAVLYRGGSARTLPSPELARGGTVLLGAWEQDGDEGNGPEPLEWIVLDSYDGELLLLCRFCIDCLPYHDAPGDITWEDCSLRAWLNGSFLQTAFDESERALMLPADAEAADADHVTLLTAEQMRVFLGSEEARWDYARAPATPWAVLRGVDTDADGCCAWWLRDRGNESYSAQLVLESGEIYAPGAEADIDYAFGVRPVLRVRAL